MRLRWPKPRRRSAIWLTGALLLAAAVTVSLLIRQDCGQPPLPTGQLLVGDTWLTVEIAEEPAERAAGLSKRCGLVEGQGMVFLFGQPTQTSFWMKEMRFPLDIVWITGRRIVQIDADVPAPAPGEEPAIVTPWRPVDTVLEVPAGYAAKQGWRLGMDTALRLPAVGPE